jgi:hypothetical protein
MMLSTHAATMPRRVPPNPPPLTAEPGTDPIAWLGPIEDVDHILVFGGQGPELMCALLHAGAANVTHLRGHERPEPDSASLVIVPRVPSIDWLATALPSICRALTSGGRLMLHAGGPAATRTRIGRMLTLLGLTAVQTHATADGQVLSATRPGRQFA